MNDWNYVLKFYKNVLGIPEFIAESISVYDILKNCACGLSNYRISKRYNINDIDYVAITIYQYFKFPGWQFDLDFSPLAIYNKVQGNYDLYLREIDMISRASFDKYTDESFRVCKEFNELKKEISKYYE